MHVGDRLMIVDLSVPDQPRVRGQVQLRASIAALIADGSGAWVLEAGGWRRLFRLDASDMDHPMIMAELPLAVPSLVSRALLPSVLR